MQAVFYIREYEYWFEHDLIIIVTCWKFSHQSKYIYLTITGNFLNYIIILIKYLLIPTFLHENIQHKDGSLIWDSVVNVPREGK